MTILLVMVGLNALVITLSVLSCVDKRVLQPYDEEHEKAIREVQDAEKRIMAKSIGKTKETK